MGSLLKNPKFKNEHSKAANIKPEAVTESKEKTASIDFRNNLRRVPPKSNSFKSGKYVFRLRQSFLRRPEARPIYNYIN
jgi:hypothetical protein